MGQAIAVRTDYTAGESSRWMPATSAAELSSTLATTSPASACGVPAHLLIPRIDTTQCPKTRARALHVSVGHRLAGVAHSRRQ